MAELRVTDPATGKTVGSLPCTDADELVGAARAAHPGWQRTPAAQRAARLKHGAPRLQESREDGALLQTREGGKPLGGSRGGVEAGVAAVEQHAGLGRCTAGGPSS